jgi:hypothetical protein
MRHNKKNESGQAAVILALAFVGLLAFSALAIDGGNAYLTRRNAQNAADAASMAGTRELHQILRVLEPWEMPGDPDGYLRQVIVEAAQRNGVPDTNDDSNDTINTNIEAWYVNEDGEKYTGAPVGNFFVIPPGARGIAATAHIPFDTFIAHIIGRNDMKATTDAGSIFTERGGAVSATIYANSPDCDPNTLTLNGSHQVIGGGIHSNGDVHINGNTADPSVYTGTLEYVSEALIQGAIIVNPPDNQASQVPERVLPLLFEIEDFAPGGARAEAAGDNYYYFSAGDYPVKVRSQDLRSLDLLDNHGNLEPGLYFADTKFELSGTLIGTEGVTFVARDSLSLSCSGCFFTKWEPQLLFFALKGAPGTCNDVAISISASDTQWFGLVYAPYGGVNMSSAGNLAVWGSIVGYTVDLSGSQIEVHYRPELDPPIPPKVVLIW